MFQNIPPSPNHQNATLLLNTFSQGTLSSQQGRITPIISAQKSTPSKEKPKIFSQTPTMNQNGSLHNIQRYQTQSISIPSSSINVTQKPQIIGNFFMSSHPSEKRLSSQDSIRTIQHTITANYAQNINLNSPYQLSSHPILKISTSDPQNQNAFNLKDQEKQQPLIQSIVFQPSTHLNDEGQYVSTTNNKEINNEITQNYPFKPTQESKFEVFEGNNNYQSIQENNLHITIQQKQIEEEKLKNMICAIISEHKKSFEENIFLSSESIKTETSANQKSLKEIKESIEQSKNVNLYVFQFIKELEINRIIIYYFLIQQIQILNIKSINLFNSFYFQNLKIHSTSKDIYIYQYSEVLTKKQLFASQYKIFITDYHQFIIIKLKDVLSQLSQTFQERYEKLSEEQNNFKINLQEIVESIQKKVEQEYQVQMGKCLNEKISKIIQDKWEEVEQGVQQQIQGLQVFLNGFDDKHSQAFIECGGYLTQLKSDIEKVFNDGQNYFKVNLDAFGQNISDKINTADIKSVFIQMNEGFYDQLQNKLDSLKVRTDSVSGTLKSMQDEQSKKLEQLENDLNQYFVSLQNGVEQLEKSQQKVEQNVIGFQKSSQIMQQYKDKIDIIENIVRNLNQTQQNSQLNYETSIYSKFDKLVEALTKIQANFLQLKQKYDTESQEWKKYTNQNSTLNDSKQSIGNISTQSIASFNSQLIQLQNSNKSLTDTIRSKEQMISEQKILIENFEKKISTQQNQLTNLLKELKQIKYESKQRQNTNMDMNSSLLSSIQSIKSSGINQSLADSLHHDFINNAQVFTQPSNTQQSNKYATCDFNQLEDYQEDLDDEDLDDQEYFYENSQDQTSTEKDIQEYFRNLKTEGQTLQNSNRFEQDFFFYPHNEEIQDVQMTLTNQFQDQRPQTTKNSQVSKLNFRQQMFLATQPSKNLFMKKPLNGVKQSIRPRRTLPKKGSLNIESNIENNFPTIKNPISTKSLTKIPIQIEQSQQKQQISQNFKSESNQTPRSNQIASPNTNLQSNQVNCFSKQLKDKNSFETTLPQLPIASTQNSQDNSQSMNSQTNITTYSNTDNFTHLIKRSNIIQENIILIETVQLKVLLLVEICDLYQFLIIQCNINNKYKIYLSHIRQLIQNIILNQIKSYINLRQSIEIVEQYQLQLNFIVFQIGLLYNNTLKEKKETKLKVRIEDSNKLKDEFGKFIYDKNGQAIIFTAQQLDYLMEEIQIIEII